MAKQTGQNKEKQRRARRRIDRELPPVRTMLRARFRGQELIAEVVRSGADPTKRMIRFGQQEYRSMTGATIAITGHAVNGWRFWHAEKKRIFAPVK